MRVFFLKKLANMKMTQNFWYITNIFLKYLVSICTFRETREDGKKLSTRERRTLSNLIKDKNVIREADKGEAFYPKKIQDML